MRFEVSTKEEIERLVCKMTELTLGKDEFFAEALNAFLSSIMYFIFYNCPEEDLTTDNLRKMFSIAYIPTSEAISQYDVLMLKDELRNDLSLKFYKKFRMYPLVVQKQIIVSAYVCLEEYELQKQEVFFKSKCQEFSKPLGS